VNVKVVTDDIRVEVVEVEVVAVVVVAVVAVVVVAVAVVSVVVVAVVIEKGGVDLVSTVVTCFLKTLVVSVLVLI